jgi:1-deoxy-D-xylulose-5-phosphate reductoisomerase
MKNVVILGSTGSIGRSTLEVISKFPERFRVIGLSTNTSADRLIEQAVVFKVPYVAVSDERAYLKVKDALKGKDTKVLSGKEGLVELACLEDAHTVVAAIVGCVGLIPTYEAMRAGKVIALANKEVLVAAGSIFMRESSRNGSKILPVDSEHSALFQCLLGQDRGALKKIVLTASGGPFHGLKRDVLADMTAELALKHPNWSMGRKITIDSATLMNKGLEVIEAHHLFGLPLSDIEVLIHRQSIIHSMVSFRDGSYIAQMSNPDMKGPIAFALSYPERLEGVMQDLDLSALSGLTFERPDLESFPCLGLAYEALRIGKTMPAVLNAANEVAVSAFLDGIIGFNEISVIIERVMDVHEPLELDSLETALEADQWARKRALEVIKS